ncbi:MAG: nucleoside-diphosphate sugar epimerase/dehydratase [bacterium]|nr:nucleoside-diphosphate sugar epimerase/dehydratase [bacterium]
MKNKKKRVLIVGAGVAGEMVVAEVLNHPEIEQEIVGLVDDDPGKLGKSVYGKIVLGSSDDIYKICQESKIEEILIAIPSANGKVVRSIIEKCKMTKANFKIVPGIYKIITGDVHINQIREVLPEDLLGREMVRTNFEEIGSFLKNKRVLITGGGGSIGSELGKQLAKFKLEKLIILDHNENNIYFTEIELLKNNPNLSLEAIIADIKDYQRIEQVFQDYIPNIIFHAAAHKHVPLMERYPEEAVKNNIFGTKNLMEISHKYKVEKFILISTDKAVNPTSVMGATKRVAELLKQLYEGGSTKFISVRFGNVLGSNGSVVPLFKKQIQKGGPITITHPEVERYFMTIQEAVSLIIQASAIGKGEEVFVLDMGQQIKIVNLAKVLITLSGMIPEEDIEIKFVGLRPGEKISEELLTQKESLSSTKYEKIFVACPDNISKEKIKESIINLEKLSKKEDIVKILKDILINYKPSLFK